MKSKFLLFFCLSICAGLAFSQNKTYKNEAGFQTDNDGILAQGSDRYYTAGNFFFFRHALNISNPDSNKLCNKILTFELGQKIYTPQTADIPSAQYIGYIDRPFAGYLYIGSNLNLLYKNESNLKLQAQLGMTGPNAYARQIQELIHSTLGFYKPAGWEYQIQNALQVNLGADYNRLLARATAVDLVLNTNAALGTGLTGATAGVTARLGKFNQLFNSVSTGSTVSKSNKFKQLNNSELFFYYKPFISAVIYNATIQGGLFENGTGSQEIRATKKPIILGQQLGAGLVKGHWVADISAVFETRETREMVQAHSWGSISLLYRFN